jgi:ATP-dependent helicase Lhr and Lhr-like helicase
MLAVAPAVLDLESSPTDQSLQLAAELSPETWHGALAAARASAPVQPMPDERAIHGLKFSAALPDELARQVLATRLADSAGAHAVLAEPVRWESGR